MASEKILIVEDEKDVAELIRYNLNRYGYGTDAVLSGRDALYEVLDNKPDLILLDVMIPEIDGFEVCSNLKENPITADIPVIMLTARGSDADIARGLEMGADDYITKPFCPRVLVERIKAVLERKKRPVEEDITIEGIDGMELDSANYRVKLKDKLIDLTRTEFDFFKFLVRRAGHSAG